MFRISLGEAVNETCFPRMRGDVPGRGTRLVMRSAFSPHARGCSLTAGAFTGLFSVFPACAGMFPVMDLLGQIAASFPRMRGDVP